MPPTSGRWAEAADPCVEPQRPSRRQPTTRPDTRSRRATCGRTIASPRPRSSARGTRSASSATPARGADLDVRPLDRDPDHGLAGRPRRGEQVPRHVDHGASSVSRSATNRPSATWPGSRRADQLIAPMQPGQFRRRHSSSPRTGSLDELYAETERLLREETLHHLAKALIERDSGVGQQLIFAEVEQAHPQLLEVRRRRSSFETSRRRSAGWPAMGSSRSRSHLGCSGRAGGVLPEDRWRAAGCRRLPRRWPGPGRRTAPAGRWSPDRNRRPAGRACRPT